MTFLYSLLAFVLIVLGITLMAKQDGSYIVLGFFVLFAGIFIGVLLLTPDIFTEKEKCERSGFTWKSTDQLVETSDGFEYQYVCVP